MPNSPRKIVSGKRYVLPNCGLDDAGALDFCRLYAFNVKESNVPRHSEGTFRILDSGAFHLHAAKKSMDNAYIEHLFSFYAEHGRNDSTFCIAPDVVGNAKKSMAQYAEWASNAEGFTLVPVIQLGMGRMDLYSAKRQADFYAGFSPGMVAFANNIGRADVVGASALKSLNKFLRAALGADVWIHILGAGYDCQDAVDWLSAGFDSCDSIAYYTAAQGGERWLPFSHEHEPAEKADWRKTAIENATVVNSCIYQA